MNLMSYTYVDLFCGAGGLSKGFSSAGFKNIFSIEFNKDFAKTYKRNFPNHHLLVKDIRDLKTNELNSITKNKQIDVVVGGPPCQGFSKAGYIGRSFIDDDRNRLFKEFVRIVDILSPKVFVMENVAAMATHLKGKTIKEIITTFQNSSIGYRVQWKILNSVDYGVAQERRRIFIVGVRNDIKHNFIFPAKQEKKLTIKDVIDDLPPLKSGESSNIPNHNAMKHTAQMLEKMSYIKDGGDRYDIPENLRPKSGDIRKYIRYNSQKPSVCVTGDMRKIFHYSQNRALTCRELARIQSFDDDFIFEGSSIQIQQQIGNAVPPKLANVIAHQVEDVLRDS